MTPQSSDSVTPYSRLVDVLVELDARLLADVGTLDKHGHGFRCEFWSVRGKPVIVQLTAGGGYDLYIPITDSIQIEATEGLLRLYAERRTWLAVGNLRSNASSPAGVSVDAPNSDRGSGAQPDVKAEGLSGGSGKLACDYHQSGGCEGGRWRVLKMKRQASGDDEIYQHTVCYAVAETWKLNGLLAGEPVDVST